MLKNTFCHYNPKILRPIEIKSLQFCLANLCESCPRSLNHSVVSFQVGQEEVVFVFAFFINCLACRSICWSGLSNSKGFQSKLLIVDNTGGPRYSRTQKPRITKENYYFEPKLVLFQPKMPVLLFAVWDFSRKRNPRE